jgi:hypothetical protein
MRGLRSQVASRREQERAGERANGPAVFCAMGRFLIYSGLSLRRSWWVFVLGAASILVATQWMHHSLAEAGAAVAVGVVAVFYRWLSHLWRLGMTVRRFRSFAADGVVIRYSPEVKDRVDLPSLAREWSEAVTDVGRVFERPLRRPLVVYLFPTMSEMGRLFEMEMGASALAGADAVTMATDSFPASGLAAEVARHEIVHLFSAQLGTLEPSLKSEGLAVDLQGGWDGLPLEFHALAMVLGRPLVPLSFLADETRFREGHRPAYVLAGSFTRYLRRRFGWETYARFFRKAGPRGYVSVIRSVFGADLWVLEREWREDLLARREEFGADLEAAVRRERAAAAFDSWQPLHCLELVDDLVREGQESDETRWLAAAANMMLGRYAEAAKVMEQTLGDSERGVAQWESGEWLTLGRLYDVLGRREEAVRAYRAALDKPVSWTARSGSSHDVAGKYLKTPMTERELLDELFPGERRPLS